MRFAGPGDGPASNRALPFINFNASYIFVLGGKLEIGTEAQPLLNKVTITLHGDRLKSIEIPGVGAKTLGVMNAPPGNFAPTAVTAVPDNDPGLLLQVPTHPLDTAHPLNTPHSLNNPLINTNHDPGLLSTVLQNAQLASMLTVMGTAFGQDLHEVPRSLHLPRQLTN